MKSSRTVTIVVATLSLFLQQRIRAQEVIPPLAKIKADHPRVLIRPNDTNLAISLAQLRSIPRDGDFQAILRQLQGQKNAAAQAMVWLLTADEAAAGKAIARMRAYRYPGKVDTFHIFFNLTELGLAYDWLYNFPSFTKEIKAEVRAAVAPLVREAMRVANDHMFHNYIWMSAGGAAMWTLATAGEDEQSDQFFDQVRKRFNDGLFPAWRYLDGLPSEPMGYWALYVFTPGVYTVMATQSAFEMDLISRIQKDEKDWLGRHVENLIHSTLPDTRYIPWGDLQGGPNGGVTHEMAGVMDASTWAMKSPRGRYFGQWLAGKRGLARFQEMTPIFYMLYTTRLAATPELKPSQPPLSFLAGNKQSGHFVARSGWGDGDTVVAFTCTDHFGDHHHYDQGGFTVYRRGLLAVDPPVYRQVAGPQQKTENHNTLLIGGQPQRRARGQWFVTIEDFKKNLTAGRKLETGDILFSHEGGTWAAAAGQFAQAYDVRELKSCVRQVLFTRPSTVVIVDQLTAAEGQQLPEVQWLLQVPAKPQEQNGAMVASNGKSWIRCRAILPEAAASTVEPTPVNTQRVSYKYAGGKASVVLIHVIDVGDGAPPDEPRPSASVKATLRDGGIDVTVGGQRFMFTTGREFSVQTQR